MVLSSETLAALSSVAQFTEDRPDLLYRPGPTVGRFLGTATRLALLIAANQIGKTSGLCKWANDRCLGYDGTGPGVLLVMIADLDNQYPVFCEKLNEVAARSELDPACKYIDGKGYYTHGKRLVKYKNGAKMSFRGGKGEVMAAASVTCDLGVVVDEIPFRGHFNEGLRAAQRWMAPVRVGFTAVGRPADWFRKRVAGLEGKPPDDVDPRTGKPLWEVFNCGLSLEECPWMTKEQIELIYAQVDPAEADQRIHGKWEGPTPDRLMNGMASSVVIADIPEGKWTVTVTCDHGELAGHEHASVILDDGTRAVIAAEYVNDSATTPEEDALGIRDMLASIGCPIARVDRWIGDVNSSGKRGAGRKVNDDLADALSTLAGAPGLVRFTKPDKTAGSVEYGRRIVNYALRRGELFVLDGCPRVIAALWHHRKDGDQYTHAIDMLRYGLMPVFRRLPAYSALNWKVA